MRPLALLLLATSFCGFSAANAQEPLVIPAPDIQINPSDDAALWHVLGLRPGDVLNIRSAPSPTGRIIGDLEEGEPVRNLGCRERDGGFWCRVSTYGRPRISGWVNGRYISDEFVEPPPVDMPAPGFSERPRRDPQGRNGGALSGRYDETGAFNCRMEPDPRLYSCPFGILRVGTSAVIDVETPDGFVRQLRYRAGRFTSLDGTETRSRKQGGEALVTVDGAETYNIPDDVVLDW